VRWLKQKMDRWAISAAAKALPRVAPDASQKSEVERTLARHDLFLPPESTPNVTLNGDFTWHFESSIRTPFAANNVVHGRLFPAGRDWRDYPSVVLVHGWNAEMHYLKVLPRVANALARAGMNGVLLELPYHLHRRPAREEKITDFISENIPRMLEATTQAVADLNGAIHWLKSAGSPRVGTWGFSLGGWLAGLHLCASPAQDAAVLMTPVSDLETAVRELEFCHPIRSALSVIPVSLAALNLHSRTPTINATRILLVEAQYDQFVPHSSYVELASAWKIEKWEPFRESHLSILISRRATRTALEWLATRLTA
jgi:dienelactone hydrolase